MCLKPCLHEIRCPGRFLFLLWQVATSLPAAFGVLEHNNNNNKLLAPPGPKRVFFLTGDQREKKKKKVKKSKRGKEGGEQKEPRSNAKGCKKPKAAEAETGKATGTVKHTNRANLEHQTALKAAR